MSSTVDADQATLRYHGLDAARAFALLLGVFFHGIEAFVPYVPAAQWFIKDSEQSVAAGIFFYLCHVFRMPVFFLIAGFFARLLLHRIGLAAFVAHRAKRILLPLVIFWCLLFPVAGVLFVWGGRLSGARELPQSVGGDLGAEGTNALARLEMLSTHFSTLHLWFLYYLAMLYVLALAGWLVLRSAPRLTAALDRIGAAALSGLPGLLLLVAPMAAALAFAPNLFGIFTPNQTLIPDPLVLASYGLCFAVGWLLHRQRELLPGLARRWWVYLLLGGLLCLPLLGVVDYADRTGDEGPALRVAWALLYATVLWAGVFGTVGGFLRFADRERPWVRYLADSSYWVYLMHIPLVAGLQIATWHLPLPWAVEYTLIMLIALPILLGSYHLVVRATFVGVLLNGRRYPLRG